jgi:hypothetical protein
VAKKHQRLAHLPNGKRVVRVECYRYLKFHPRFRVSVLQASEESHRCVRHTPVRIPVERFKEQLLRARFILLDRAAE